MTTTREWTPFPMIQWNTNVEYYNICLFPTWCQVTWIMVEDVEFLNYRWLQRIPRIFFRYSSVSMYFYSCYDLASGIHLMTGLDCNKNQCIICNFTVYKGISVTLDAQGIMPGQDRNKNQCVFWNVILGQVTLSLTFAYTTQTDYKAMQDKDCICKFRDLLWNNTKYDDV